MTDETGRVRQKQRTRKAIVDAAQRLLEGGVVPTVASAAAEADVGRTTAYRYFPTQDSLLVELAVSSDVADVEELAAAPVSPEDARARVLQVIRLLNRHVLAEEVRYRTATRLYQDQWLAAHEEGEADPVVREGRRRRWFTQVLAPLMGEHGLKPSERTRLVDRLSLVCGAEPMIVLRDVCRLDGDAALDAAQAVAGAILDDAFGPEPRRRGQGRR
jgi:AcrR family transcriptional regulator